MFEIADTMQDIHYNNTCYTFIQVHIEHTAYIYCVHVPIALA